MLNFIYTKQLKLLLPVLFTTIFAFALFIPEYAAAGNVCQVLKDPNQSQSIRDSWQLFITAVDYLILALLILIAFAQILRIQVDSYGVKKVLPTLILAIVAAQFSYKIVQLLVDVANVTVTFFSDSTNPNGASEIGKSIAQGIAPNFDWPRNSILDGVVNNLVMLVTAIEFFILGILFVAREWIIYILTIISPIAFMAIVLPQTKTYFSKWFTEISKWIFMPIVSVAILWLGQKIIPIVEGANDYTGLLRAIFYAILLYFAITIPLKMGGPVFDNMMKFSGASFLGGKMKEYATTGLKAKGMAQWNRWQRTGLDMVRKGGTVGKFVGNSFLFGSGLAKAKADLKFEEKMAAGIEEGYQARYNFDKGDKRQMNEEYIKNRQGEIKEYERYALLRLTGRGENDPMYKQWVDWRLGSGLARTKMMAADLIETSQIDSGIAQAINGGSEGPEAEGKREMPEKRWLDQVGMKEDEWRLFQERLQESKIFSVEISKIKEKAEKDLLTKGAQQMVGLQEVAQMTQAVKDTQKAFSELPPELKEIFERLSRERKTLEQIDEADKRLLEEKRKEASDYLTMRSRATALMRGHSVLDGNEFYNGSGDANDIDKGNNADEHGAKVVSDLEKAIAARKAKGLTPVEGYLRDQVQYDEATGKVTLKTLGRTAFTRLQGIANEKLRGRASGYAELSTSSLMDVLEFGDKKDGMTAEMAQDFISGTSLKDPNKASRFSAAWIAATGKLEHGNDAPEVASRLITMLPDHKVIDAAKQWASKEQGKGRQGDAENLRMQLETVSDASTARGLMDKYYNTYQQNSQRGDLNAVLKYYMPEARYT